MNLLTISYPELSATDFELIENSRKTHDKLYKIVKPHFTLIFPVSDFAIADFVTEIKEQLKAIKSFPFCIRSATINKDAFNETYHTFLVPDEGFSQMVKLHDKLYSDKLSKHHRLDIDFIPHITIGNSTDKMICKEMADEWNKKNFAIKGVISSVDIVNYENESVTILERIKLTG